MTGTTLPSVDFCVYNESKRKHALSELLMLCISVEIIRLFAFLEYL